MILIASLGLAAQPVLSEVRDVPAPAAAPSQRAGENQITFAPDGSVRGSREITFRNLDGHTRVIVVRSDGSVRAE